MTKGTDPISRFAIEVRKRRGPLALLSVPIDRDKVELFLRCAGFIVLVLAGAVGSGLTSDDKKAQYFVIFAVGGIGFCLMSLIKAYKRTKDE